ncbi:response regulator transcription factor [Nonomuraea purpurea]|uniref:Response regulator transcription factor n=1 Tax=Nonomuraea purpurea TaxID=1849276 RepID=A0ABV8GL93_9ACTN
MRICEAQMPPCAAGNTNAEIARILAISPGTVKIHIERIPARLGPRTRVQAAAYAHRHGLSTWPDPQAVIP